MSLQESTLKGGTRKPLFINKQNERKGSGPPRVYANRYRSLRTLGSGRFGTVFLVEDTRMNQNDLYFLIF